MKLHAYEQSSNVPNGVPLDDTIGKAREFEMSGLAINELDHSPLHLELEQLSIQGGEDNEDGTNRAQDTDNFKEVGISYTFMSMSYVIYALLYKHVAR
jgi:hypothetical protein